MIKKFTTLYGPNSCGKSSIIYAVLVILRYVYGIPTIIIGAPELEEVIEHIGKFMNYNVNRTVIGAKVAIPDYEDYIYVEIGVESRDKPPRNIPTRRWFKLDKLMIDSTSEGTRILIDSKLIESKYKYAPLPEQPNPLLTPSIISDDGLLSKGIVEEIGDVYVKIRDAIVSVINKSILYHEHYGVDLVSKISESVMRYIRVLNREELINTVRNLLYKLLEYGVRKEFLGRIIDDLNYICGPDFRIDDLSISRDEVKFISNGNTFKISQLSDGLLNTMRILLHAYEINLFIEEVRNIGISIPGGLLILDTPEFNIHIDWLVKLMEVLKDIENVQVIIETHSGILISWMLKYDQNVYYLLPKDLEIEIHKLSKELIMKKTIELFERELRAYQEAKVI